MSRQRYAPLQSNHNTTAGDGCEPAFQDPSRTVRNQSKTSPRPVQDQSRFSPGTIQDQHRTSTEPVQGQSRTDLGPVQDQSKAPLSPEELADLFPLQPINCPTTGQKTTPPCGQQPADIIIWRSAALKLGISQQGTLPAETHKTGVAAVSPGTTRCFFPPDSSSDGWFPW